jgi:hypothetical protein
MRARRPRRTHREVCSSDGVAQPIPRLRSKACIDRSLQGIALPRGHPCDDTRVLEGTTAGRSSYTGNPNRLSLHHKPATRACPVSNTDLFKIWLRYGARNAKRSLWAIASISPCGQVSPQPGCRQQPRDAPPKSHRGTPGAVDHAEAVRWHHWMVASFPPSVSTPVSGGATLARKRCHEGEAVHASGRHRHRSPPFLP